ncbi:MAG: FeoB-associated Cys-rich membrane protein [Clostridia bacterium]|nr:FeoB-associated Cys-rich membrane protein [Clostridia bacterium]
MLSYLAENISTVVIAALLIFAVACAIRKMINNKKQGKSSCGCGCSDCALGDKCHKK